MFGVEAPALVIRSTQVGVQDAGSVQFACAHLGRPVMRSAANGARNMSL